MELDKAPVGAQHSALDWHSRTVATDEVVALADMIRHTGGTITSCRRADGDTCVVRWLTH